MPVRLRRSNRKKITFYSVVFGPRAREQAIGLGEIGEERANKVKRVAELLEALGPATGSIPSLVSLVKLARDAPLRHPTETVRDAQAIERKVIVATLEAVIPLLSPSGTEDDVAFFTVYSKEQREKKFKLALANITTTKAVVMKSTGSDESEVLTFLSEGGKKTTTQVAEGCHCTYAKAYSILFRLVSSGLVERHEGPLVNKQVTVLWAHASKEEEEADSDAAEEVEEEEPEVRATVAESTKSDWVDAFRRFCALVPSARTTLGVPELTPGEVVDWLASSAGLEEQPGEEATDLNVSSVYAYGLIGSLVSVVRGDWKGLFGTVDDVNGDDLILRVDVCSFGGEVNIVSGTGENGAGEVCARMFGVWGEAEVPMDSLALHKTQKFIDVKIHDVEVVTEDDPQYDRIRMLQGHWDEWDLKVSRTVVGWMRNDLKMTGASFEEDFEELKRLVAGESPAKLEPEQEAQKAEQGSKKAGKIASFCSHVLLAPYFTPVDVKPDLTSIESIEILKSIQLRLTLLRSEPPSESHVQEKALLIAALSLVEAFRREHKQAKTDKRKPVFLSAATSVVAASTEPIAPKLETIPLFDDLEIWRHPLPESVPVSSKIQIRHPLREKEAKIVSWHLAVSLVSTGGSGAKALNFSDQNFRLGQRVSRSAELLLAAQIMEIFGDSVGPLPSLPRVLEYKSAARIHYPHLTPGEAHDKAVQVILDQMEAVYFVLKTVLKCTYKPDAFQECVRILREDLNLLLTPLQRIVGA